MEKSFLRNGMIDFFPSEFGSNHNNDIEIDFYQW